MPATAPPGGAEAPPDPAGHRRVDPAQARRVAAAFVAAPRHVGGADVAVAYADLARQSARWYDHLTGPQARRPVRVVFTRCREPYATAAELTGSIRQHALLELWPTSRDHDRRHPLLDADVGGAFDRVRAVHDIVSHGWCGHGFDADGEYSAWLTEHRLYRGEARWALATELHAQHSVQWTTGDLADHKAVVLHRTLVRRSLAGPDPIRSNPCASS